MKNILNYLRAEAVGYECTNLKLIGYAFIPVLAGVSFIALVTLFLEYLR